MHYIQLTKELIVVILKELTAGLKKHKMFALVFPLIGLIIAVITFFIFDIIKEKVATVLFGIAGSFIGTIFVFQMQEITKDKKKIKSLNVLEKNIDDLTVNPSVDGSSEEKVYDLFKEIFKETIK